MNDSSRDLKELQALNARFIHNFVTNDVASHDAITHPRFLYISSAGARVGRARYLHEWATGFDPEVIVYWDLRDEHIDVFGDFALVRATNKHVQIRDGREVTAMSAYTDAYVREGGRWLCVQAQITHVAPEHYPGDDTIVRRYIKGVLQPDR
jgi:ketosteroid isomerase-like protein